MKIQVLSDLHVEHHRDGGRTLLNTLPVTAPVLVMAGDLGDLIHLIPSLRVLCRRWDEVIYVTGNHEYWGTDLSTVHKSLAAFAIKTANFHWLNNSDAVVQGQHFIGGTLWFPFDPLNEVYAPGMPDFTQIKGFRQWVYQSNRELGALLSTSITPSSVVVTHHLPSPQSTPERFRGSQINRFFVSDQSEIIRLRRPPLWIHGHTHSPADYMQDETWILCNPLGYPHENNRLFNEALSIAL